jgi:hypothetical protein
MGLNVGEAFDLTSGWRLAMAMAGVCTMSGSMAALLCEQQHSNKMRF